MKKFVIITIVLLLLSCTPKYIYEYEYRNGIIIDKEMHTELDPTTELLFDIKTTRVVYSLIVEYNGHVKSHKVSENEYYNNKIGSTYPFEVLVKKKNPNYKKEDEKWN